MRPALVLLTLCTAFGQGIWEARAPFPIAATEVSAAAIENKIYTVCGLTAQGSVNSLFIYDAVTDSWKPGASLPIDGGADHCNVAAAGGKLYVLGAIRIGSSFVAADTYEYDPATDRWQIAGRMPTPRGASGVAAIGTRIYVAGGLAAEGSVSTFEVFDTATRQWSRLPNMPTARDHLTAQAVDGKFYAISGRVGDVLKANEQYDPATNAWSTRAGIPTPRGGLASGVIGNRIQVFGGEGPSGTPEGTYRQNEEYDPAADTWRSLTAMSNPRHGLYGATVTGRIFTPAGGPRAGAFYSTTHDAFYLPPAEPPAPDAALNAASFAASLAPGSLVSLFGRRLAQGEQVAVQFPLPGRMNSVFVEINGNPAPLLYVGPGQINFHLPYNLAPGPISLVTYNAGTRSLPLALPALRESAPGIFMLSQDGQGAILIAGTGLIARATRDSRSMPARKGQVVEIYCTGLGRLIDPPPIGQPAPASPLARTVETPRVTIGGADAELIFSGLAPGLAGVYQVNARVPQGAATGSDVPVTVQIPANGPLSNRVTMAVID